MRKVIVGSQKKCCTGGHEGDERTNRRPTRDGGVDAWCPSAGPLMDYRLARGSMVGLVKPLLAMRFIIIIITRDQHSFS